MLKHKKWIPIAVVVLFIQAVLEGFALFQVIRMNILPIKYLVIVFAVAAVLLLVTAVLLFSGLKHGPSRKRRARRVIAVILAVVVGAGSGYVSWMVSRLGTSVDKVTSDEDTLSAVIGVYVMKDDPAETLTDAKDYTFGIMSEFDQENTKNGLSQLNSEIGKDVETSEFSSVTESAQALYDDQVDAILINEAYASALEDIEGFENFGSETRLLAEFSVFSSEDSDNDASVSSGSGSQEQSSKENAANGVSDIVSKPFVVYISGSDTRSEILKTSRSDVNILMAVNPTTKQILLLNTPRDYYVDNPAGGGAKDKLTHCGLYGVDCSIQALENLYSTDVNYYLQINFTGFENLIDSIGGITVTVPEDFSAGGFSFHKGEQQVNGEEALAFARERHSFASGDRQRGKNQMEVIRAVIEKITSGTTVLTNYSQILNSLQDMMVTNISSDEIAGLVKMQLGDNAKWSVSRYAVDGSGASKTTYSMPSVRAYVMIPDQETVDRGSALLKKIMNGETISEADVAD
ncbi:MAG: LCP family protein [Bilifractor sp.]|jgi:LCP family protein required for cell wall assembly